MCDLLSSLTHILVPWTDLATKPTIIEIEDIFILVSSSGSGSMVF
jgi:hypothetical protein